MSVLDNRRSVVGVIVHLTIQDAKERRILAAAVAVWRLLGSRSLLRGAR